VEVRGNPLPNIAHKEVIMPYSVRAVGDGRFTVVNTETGNVHSKGTTKANAEAQVRLLHGVEHGMRPRTTREVMGTHPQVQGKTHRMPGGKVMKGAKHPKTRSK